MSRAKAACSRVLSAGTPHRRNPKIPSDALPAPPRPVLRRPTRAKYLVLLSVIHSVLIVITPSSSHPLIERPEGVFKSEERGDESNHC